MRFQALQGRSTGATDFHSFRKIGQGKAGGLEGQLDLHCDHPRDIGSGYLGVFKLRGASGQDERGRRSDDKQACQRRDQKDKTGGRALSAEVEQIAIRGGG
ncbi:hypothetical protein GCM10007242_28110 [Pigmentiphaga litoralis]|nr:hypothetical protein GCM10007242_28110 [Pigmentiphaga litoralis]